jgi:hypothetical protein
LQIYLQVHKNKKQKSVVKESLAQKEVETSVTLPPEELHRNTAMPAEELWTAAGTGTQLQKVQFSVRTKIKHIMRSEHNAARKLQWLTG